MQTNIYIHTHTSFMKWQFSITTQFIKLRFTHN